MHPASHAKSQKGKRSGRGGDSQLRFGYLNQAKKESQIEEKSGCNKGSDYIFPYIPYLSLFLAGHRRRFRRDLVCTLAVSFYLVLGQVGKTYRTCQFNACTRASPVSHIRENQSNEPMPLRLQEWEKSFSVSSPSSCLLLRSFGIKSAVSSGPGPGGD